MVLSEAHVGPLRQPVLARPAVVRIVRIHRLVAGRRYPNVPYLSRHLEVSTRTVERDLECLRDQLGAPLRFDRRRNGYFYSEPGFALPQVQLSEGEVLLVLLGCRLLAQYRGTPYDGQLRQALAKMALSLSEVISFDPNAALDDVSFHVERLRGSEETVAAVFAEVAAAIRDQRRLVITYHAASTLQTSERSVDPYHLRFVDGAWYLIAYCHLRASIRLFALDRIGRVAATGERFEVVEGYSLDELLSPALRVETGPAATVEVWFDSWVARWVRERVWHESQEMVDLPGGELRLRLTVTAAPGGLGEVKRWVLQYGSHARVLSPPWLVAEVRREHELALQGYASSLLTAGH